MENHNRDVPNTNVSFMLRWVVNSLSSRELLLEDVNQPQRISDRCSGWVFQVDTAGKEGCLYAHRYG